METQEPTFRGKTAVVTGAARRIGRAVAVALAENGADVILHYLGSTVEAQETASHIESLGRKVWILQADFGDPDEAEDFIPRASKLAGPIHMLVNSASIFPSSQIADVKVEDFNLNAQVNAYSPFLITRAFWRQGIGGSVVDFLDSRMLTHDAYHVAYLVSKRIFFTLTRMMALEFAPAIRVNAVAPGLILPPPGKDEAYLKKLAPEDNPLKRHGSLEVITDAVLFLLQNEFITGQVIFVDGGRHLKECLYG